MPKIRLGGIKAFEKRAYLSSSCRSGEDALVDICSRLAADRINLNLLLHIAENGTRPSITAACTESFEGFSGYIEWKASRGECSVGKLLIDTCTVSIFPHNQKLDVTGSLMGVLAGSGIRPYGFATSPSAMTMLLAASDFKAAVERLFDAFEFPAYRSPLDWHAAYRDRQDLLNEVICSYREDIIQVYGFEHQSDLDLWNITAPLESLAGFGTAMLELNALQLRSPFLVSNSSPGEASIRFAICLASTHRDRIEQLLDRSVPGLDLSRSGPVTVFFLHGPHFGDRYGIANALIKAMRNAGTPILAMSCTVASLSVVIPGNDTKPAIEALNASFKTPAGKL